MKDEYREPILEEYVVLRAVQEHPGCNGYTVKLIVDKLGLNFGISQFYELLNSLIKPKFVVRGKAFVGRMTGFSGYPLTLTSDGIKKLFELECRIRICLSFRKDGTPI